MADPIPNSSIFVFPTEIAPAASKRSTTVAEYGGMNPSSILDDAVLATPLVTKLSLMAIGMPWSGDDDADDDACIVSALSSAWSAV